MRFDTSEFPRSARSVCKTHEFETTPPAMSTPRKRHVTVTACDSVETPAPLPSERVVIVVGPEREYAETVAQGFATQGEMMRVVWFSEACQAVALGVQKALAGVIVCHHPEQAPELDLSELRRAWPDTPVLALQLAS